MVASSSKEFVTDLFPPVPPVQKVNRFCHSSSTSTVAELTAIQPSKEIPQAVGPVFFFLRHSPHFQRLLPSFFDPFATLDSAGDSLLTLVETRPKCVKGCMSSSFLQWPRGTLVQNPPCLGMKDMLPLGAVRSRQRAQSQTPGSWLEGVVTEK